MLDRAIGIFGIALALIFGLAPLLDFKMPIWLTYAGVGLGILLSGLAVGLIMGGYRKPHDLTEPQVIETNLFLQFSDAHFASIEKSQRNIRAWYALYTESIYVDTKDKDGNSLGGFSVPPRWAVFILFERPPILRQLIAICLGPNTPKANVNISNAYFAVISIVGDVTSATLDVSIVR
jgi:hypothetical protein